ncbi:hypothetical protein [Nocardioides sp. SR21]|uniref:hypothetical protein n=1 Tax=Nocardioides sp. SR21 TaxID=2919501 RepID=UPI001FAAFA5C|nr:hypothetical protein [Nocardioides sp. SR21]
MAAHLPADAEHPHAYDDRRSTITAILAVVLLNATIIGVFMFITWLTYNTD